MNPNVRLTSVTSRPSAIVIDGDGAAQNVLASYLRALDWDVRIASDGPEGLALLDERPSSLVLADWSMPGMSGLEVCSRVRQRVWAERPYVIITTGRDPHELWRALAAGADDVLRKPFERHEVETRVALARFYAEGSARLPLTEATIEATAAPAGELVIRQGEVLARLMFRAGRIVWVTVSPSRRRFADHLASELGLDDEQIREVLEESKVTGAPFDKLLVDWQLAEPHALHECLRAWMSYKLAQVKELSSPSVLFVPLPPGGLTFEGFPVDEIAPWMMPHRDPPRRSSAPPSARSDSLGHRASLAMQISGARAAFVLAVHDGTCLIQKGDRSHIEVSWALARALHAMPRDAAQSADILLTSPAYHYVARHLESDPEVLMVVVIDIAATTSGSARVQLTRIAAASRSAA